MRAVKLNDFKKVEMDLKCKELEYDGDAILTLSETYVSMSLLDLPSNLMSTFTYQELNDFPKAKEWLENSYMPDCVLPIYKAYKDSTLYIIAIDKVEGRLNIKVLYKSNDKDALMLPSGDTILILTIDENNTTKHVLSLAYDIEGIGLRYDDVFFVKEPKYQNRFSLKLNEQEPSIKDLITLYQKMDEVYMQDINALMTN